ncbi:FAD-dependent monooxygenase [Nonomuraea cavernae]|uniref:FAD-dependent oxidoreductase n=1 Tax=Nonomuraea cavernae TaxID=2045107 RepID=A0A917YPT1_9ACTN|nr:FAD-dependent monooxygenase [Nonomuraea cavernae]MCA2183483.1 FAD-dependent monooxygenase [Nonomuraea cavernae]GGO60433.1 FAD-dependent oxidoreductase [Nonomuraea cavernae]
MDVVIVGGGPSGLLMGCELALAGVRAVVLERLPERSSRPKANGLVGRVVQALDYRGLYERFGGVAGPPVPAPSFQFGALPLDLTGWAENALYTLPVPQWRMEESLEERARELGVEIRRGHEVTAIEQDDEAVTIEALGPDGGYRLSAAFLVGADGGHSTVRKQSGIGFPGFTDDGFVARSGQVVIHPPVAVPGTGDLEVPGKVGRLRSASFTRTETGVFAFGMFQPGIYRVGVQEWGRPRESARTDSSIEDLRAAVRRVLGADVPMSEPPADRAPSPATVTRGVNSRLADRYRQGRVFLVGDAAHVQSGVGGPGLNLGLQDVLNLGWKLAAAVKGWAPDGLLDSYQNERRPAGERVIMHSRAQTALLSPGPNITALREVLGELLDDRANARRLSDLLSGADLRYDMGVAGPGHPLVGGWMPDLVLGTEAGRVRVAELLRTGRPVLLDLAGRTDLVAAAEDWAGRVDVIAATGAALPAQAVLIRPDGYVAWAAQAGGGADELREALRTWFGAPVPAGVVGR